MKIAQYDGFQAQRVEHGHVSEARLAMQAETY
jgi:hypothetical protein